MSGEVDVEEALKRASEEVKKEFEKAGVSDYEWWGKDLVEGSARKEI